MAMKKYYPVHRIVSLLKRWLLGTHQSYLNKNKLEYYLDEYVFRDIIDELQQVDGFYSGD